MNVEESAFIKPRPPIFVLDPLELHKKLNFTEEQIRKLTIMNIEFLEKEAQSHAAYYKKIKEFFTKV